jgi:hypothetical protein
VTSATARRSESLRSQLRCGLFDRAQGCIHRHLHCVSGDRGAMRCPNKVRNTRCIPSAYQRSTTAAAANSLCQFIEAAVSSAYLPKLHSKFVLQPSIVSAIFIFFGSAFFLYIKAQQGPGSFAPATVLACICLGRPCPFSGVAFTILLSYRYNLSNVSFISVCLLQGLLQADLAE